MRDYWTVKYTRWNSVFDCMHLAGEFAAGVVAGRTDRQAAVGHVVLSSSQASGRTAARPRQSHPHPTEMAATIYIYL